MMKIKRESKRKWINDYLKWATAFGTLGWATFFCAVGLLSLGYYPYAYYTEGFSIFIGWFVSGYFWIRYGYSQGKNIKQMIRDRIPWSRTRKR